MTNKKQRTEQKGSRFYRNMHRLLARFLLWLFRVRVHHAEREPENEAYLLCCNHLSALDPVLLAAALKKQQPHFMAKKELFRIPLLSGLIRAFGAYPVDRAGDVKAIKTTNSLLESGTCVGMIPQGTRCAGKQPRMTLDKVKSGAGLLCDRTHVTVLPVCLKTKRDRLRIFRRVELYFGEPVRYEELAASEVTYPVEGHGHQTEYFRLSHAIFERICALYEEADHEG
ncbi:MAG: 1-acyl-sn-glycerol-3-phosphate acyltransferase [Clostridia bacterium]|nr:1-acyl-sn-glycerol-3-phosphate acyltransferase [Clostridia bacterium]